MTKYILVGGYPLKAADGGKALCEELVAGHEEPHRVLICTFARPENQWQERFEKDKTWMTSLLPNKRIEFQLADENTFVQQVQWAQTIWIQGGALESLLQRFLQHTTWTSYLEGKTVGGSSAGADVLGQYYYLLDTPGVAKGLGILPIKLLVHYRSDYNAPNIDWERAYAELKATDGNAPVLTLREGQFEVIRQ